MPGGDAVLALCPGGLAQPGGNPGLLICRAVLRRHGQPQRGGPGPEALRPSRGERLGFVGVHPDHLRVPDLGGGGVFQFQERPSDHHPLGTDGPGGSTGLGPGQKNQMSPKC